MIRVLGSRPWLFIVGQSPLVHQGSLNPSPGCLTSCGRPRPRGPGQQGSGTAHCAGFCATKARTPRRFTGGQQRLEGAEPTRRFRGARQAREQRAMAPATATRSRRGTALPHPQGRQVPRDDPRLQAEHQAHAEGSPRRLGHHDHFPTQPLQKVTATTPQAREH